MDPGQSAANFHTTRWSLVMRAQRDRAVLEYLLRLYWSPVYAFVRRQGYSGHDASDLTQEFMTTVVLGRDLFEQADPSRGRFRSFLKTALSNFLIDQHRTRRYSRRSGARSAPADAATATQEHAAADDRAQDPNALAAFDRAWARTIVEQALLATEEHCLRSGMTDHWRIFDINVVAPAMRRTEPMSLAELAERLNASKPADAPPFDEDRVSNMLQTVKRCFRRALRDAVAQTVSTPAEVEQELSDLREHL